jgi:glycosyltransferase involved in cell wall biosynthesis
VNIVRKNAKIILVRSRAIDPGIYKIATALADNDYNVKMLLWDREGKRAVQQLGYSINYFNLRAPYDKITASFCLPFWWLYEFFFLLLNAAHVVHVSDLDTLLPALCIKRLRRVRIFYSIFDFYADNLSKPLFLKKLIAFVERLGIGSTDALFLVDPSRYEQIEGARINRLSFLYNSPPDFKGKLQEAKISSEVILFYAGVIHRSRGLVNVLSAMNGVEGVKLIMAGTGPDRTVLESLPKTLQSKVKYIGYIPYEEVIRNSLSADILFALYDPNVPGNTYASPNKLFEAMMCGKPIIVNTETTAARIVEKEKCGLVVPYDDVEGIKKAILSLKQNPDQRLALGRNGRIAYEKRYNWKIMEKKLLDAYDQTLKLEVG